VMLSLMVVPATISAGNADAEWTFMVYLDADNNLEPYGVMNLEWLEAVGSVEGEVNFVVLMDTMTDFADLLYVEAGESTRIEGYGFPKEVNMADPGVLTDFVVTAVNEYPAEKYALILWDHGGGWRGLCWDDSTELLPDGSEDCITMVELRTALDDAKEQTHEVMDVVGFDLCLMAMPEVAYQVRDLADYVVFSEETVPGYGFPYEAIASDLVTTPSMDGEQLSSMIVEDYAAYYSSMTGYYDWTMSAFNMTYMDEVTETVDALGTSLLNGLDEYMNSIQKDLIAAQKYYYPYNVDLKGFAMNLYNDPTIDDQDIKDAAKAVAEAVEDGVSAYINSLHNDESYGLAIYVPSTNDGMHSLKDSYGEVPFATETSWFDFALAFSSWDGHTKGRS
jgi:clostripain